MRVKSIRYHVIMCVILKARNICVIWIFILKHGKISSINVTWYHMVYLILYVIDIYIVLRYRVSCIDSYTLLLYNESNSARVLVVYKPTNNFIP